MPTIRTAKPPGLARWIQETFGVSLSKQTMSERLRAMGLRKLSARPHHHAQDPQAGETFKKRSPRSWRTSRARRPPKHRPGIEVWFQDEARVGQKTRRHPALGTARHQAEPCRTTTEPSRPKSSARSVRGRARARRSSDLTPETSST
ncbi:winged helix-turn-helix domain-containing protein [Allostella humosa]|uniref:winged helix-turn-helix domain-containing protein n=1 Tax=Stella humosa TaxID=94 RepID=UPI000F4B3620